MPKKKSKFRPFDVAEHLRTPEEISGFLEVAIEEAEGDIATITDAIKTAARARNMSQLARDTGISREGLYRALSPGGNPSSATLAKLLRQFGLQLSAKRVG